MRWGIASIWFATGLGVLHPRYREIGAEWLSPLGLPGWIQIPVCAFELALGAWIVARPLGTVVAALQVAMVATFTIILAALDPMLLVSPFGFLTKNLPFLGLVAATWLVEKEQRWSPRTVWVLRIAMALPWLTEGLIPKILFQQTVELEMTVHFGMTPPEPWLAAIGAAQLTGGIAALLLRGRLLVILLHLQAGALIVLPLVVGWLEPELWIHPFGPLTKNLPMLAGTWVLADVIAERSAT